MPSTGTAVVTGMTGDISGSGNWSGMNLTNHEHEWYRNSLGQVAIPAQGDYTLARLAPGLPSAANFSGSNAWGPSLVPMPMGIQCGGGELRAGGKRQVDRRRRRHVEHLGQLGTAPNVPGVQAASGRRGHLRQIIQNSSATITLDSRWPWRCHDLQQHGRGCYTLIGASSSALDFQQLRRRGEDRRQRRRPTSSTPPSCWPTTSR